MCRHPGHEFNPAQYSMRITALNLHIILNEMNWYTVVYPMGYEYQKYEILVLNSYA